MGLPLRYLWKLLKNEQESRRNRRVPLLYAMTQESVLPIVRLLIVCELLEACLFRLLQGLGLWVRPKVANPSRLERSPSDRDPEKQFETVDRDLPDMDSGLGKSRRRDPAVPENPQTARKS
jgi:hypothetical protein